MKAGERPDTLTTPALEDGAAKRPILGLLSIVAPVLAAAPWWLFVPGNAPELLNSANGYGGLLLFFVVLAWSVLGFGAGLTFGILALVRQENRWIASIGIAANGLVLLVLLLKR